MAQRSRFFDSVGGDRVYGSDALAQVLYGLMGDGVVGARGGELAVTESSPPAMTVRVDTGIAFVRGYYFEVYTAAETLAIAAAHATLSRIDRVVVRRDLGGRTAALTVLSGTPAASPVAPALTQNEGGIWEIPLANVTVPAAATSIVNANISDQRGARAKGPDIDAALAALTVAWASITGKPSTFAPSAHDHASGDPEGQVPYANVSGKPSTFAPSAHASGHASGGADAVSPQALGAPLAVNTPSTTSTVRRLFVGTSTPSGTVSEGDIWVKG